MSEGVHKNLSTISNSSTLFVDTETEVVGNEAVRGQINRVAITLADVLLVLASLHDVGMDVEVGEEREHDEHVPGEQVLTPAREVTVELDTVERVRECDEELYLNRSNNT